MNQPGPMGPDWIPQGSDATLEEARRINAEAMAVARSEGRPMITPREFQERLTRLRAMADVGDAPPPPEEGSIVCPICLERPWQTMIEFNCGHLMHRDCDTRAEACPICNQPIITRSEVLVEWTDDLIEEFLVHQGLLGGDPVDVGALLTRPTAEQMELLARLEGMSPERLARVHEASFPGLSDELYGDAATLASNPPPDLAESEGEEEETANAEETPAEAGP